MQRHKDSHISHLRSRFLHVGIICATIDRISIPVGAMYLPTGMFCTLADRTYMHVGAMYLHACTC